MVGSGENAYEQLARQARLRGERAAERAVQARKRVDELRTYFRAVREGRDPDPPVDEASMARAKALAEESVRSSAQAHRDAAKSHELAAELQERLGGPVSGQAQWHRREADRHREQAAACDQLPPENPRRP